MTIIEAMKMENEITAHKAGVIAELPISEGDAVRSGDVLAVIKDAAMSAAPRAWVAEPDEAEAVAGAARRVPRPHGRRLAVGERLPGLRRAAARGPRHGVPARRARRRLAARRRAAAALSLQRLEGRARRLDRGPLRRAGRAPRAASATRSSTLAIERAARARRQRIELDATRTTRPRSRSTSATASRRARRAARGPRPVPRRAR